MAVTPNDLQELKRIATNTYDSEKAFMNRIIRGIGLLNSENQKLKNEVEELKKKLAVKAS